jgi:hypothetical protein
MIQTLRFTFLNDPALHPTPSHLDDKAYFAVAVLEVGDHGITEVIPSTLAGILPSQTKCYRNQGCHQFNLEEHPVLKKIIVSHFHRQEEWLHVAIDKNRQWPQFNNGAGRRTPDD